MFRLVLLCLCASVLTWAPVASQSCRRWCRTPQGQAYCCESGNEPISAAVTKQGQCPPVRPSCPPTRFGQPPRTCSSDGACAGYDKCCFDTCLQHHTCKPPIGLGQGGIGQISPIINPGIIAPIVNTGIIAPVASQSCRRWCRTPQGQAYCCEGANEPISAAVTKHGQCPPVRPSCPPTRFGQPPRTCSSDGACAGFDKCCFDTCLQHHTCKPPIGLGRR